VFVASEKDACFDKLSMSGIFKSFQNFFPLVLSLSKDS